MRKPVYIVQAQRSAIGNFGGSLAPLGAAEMAAQLTKAMLRKLDQPPAVVDEILLGCVLQAGLGQNVARQTAIAADLPQEKTATTINMVCGSGLRSIAMAAQQIVAEDAELILAGGTESMTNAPFLLPKARSGLGLGNATAADSIIHDGLWDAFNDFHMGSTAENLAEKYHITREEQDAFACESQNKASQAIQSGRFDEEILPLTVPRRKQDPLIFDKDEYPRPGVNTDQLAKLRPAFRPDGTVTPGNASGINDGAALALLANEDACKKHGLQPLARIASYAWHGCDPAIMGIGPVQAVRLALQKADWTLDQIDLIEANEAFAAQALAVQKELDWDPEKVNVNGGAIALGHPIGASGARILVTLIHELRKRGGQRGMATLCIGGGMGIAMCLEMV